MTEMATEITEEMSDQAFASLAASVIKSAGRELPRPLPVVKELKPKAKIELPPLGTVRPQKEYSESVSKALLHARAEARRVTAIIVSLEVEYQRVRASDAKKREIRTAMLAVHGEKRQLSKIEAQIERLQRPARAAAGVLRATVGLQTRAIESDRQMQVDRERKPRRLVQRPTRQVKVESPLGPIFDQVSGKRTNDDHVPRIVDTIDQMLKSRQINRDQETAARVVQNAWAAAPGDIRCALAAGEGGAGPGSRSPTDRMLKAGRVLNDVRQVLGVIDSLVIIRVCGMGMSVDEAARVEFAVPEGKRAGEREKSHIGMRLRMGLALLAKFWGMCSPTLQSGKSESLRTAKARDDRFVLRDFDTPYVSGSSVDIGRLTGSNKSQVEALREQENARRLLKEQRRVARRLKASAPAQGS